MLKKPIVLAMGFKKLVPVGLVCGFEAALLERDREVYGQNGVNKVEAMK